MASVNLVILVGKVGKVDVREFGSGKLAAVSLVTSEKYKDRNGEWVEDSTWHDVSVFGNLAGVVEKYVKKGSSLYVSGRIKKRKYTDRDGNERESVSIVAQNIELLDPKPKKQEPTEGVPNSDMPF